MSAGRHIQNLALTGFMGVGKSTMGRHLAASLKLKFVDTDELIEEREQKSIPEIFSLQGEDYFRNVERKLVLEMLDWDGRVISTGGGLVSFGDNMEQLKQSAFVVSLWASAETIYSRVKRQSHRPLLQGEDPLETIRSLLASRKSAYQLADLMINTDTRPMRQVSQIIVRAFREASYQSRHSA